MDETYLDVFRLLRCALFPEANTPPEQLHDWSALFAEMQAQSVAALPYAWLNAQKAQHPAETAPWLLFCLQSQGKWVRLMHAQAQLLQLLEDNGIACVILKGAAAAMAYPQPSLRAMGDVDFLVKRCDRDKTARLLEENGYRLEHEKDEKAHHYGYSRDGISFELHWRVGIVDGSNEKLLSLFETGIENREDHETEGFSFPVLPLALNGLVLVAHINQHLRSGLGLRQIIDWMLYVDRLPEEVWAHELGPLLRETGMERLALCVTALCRRTLGLKKELPGCEDIEPEVCDELLAFLMEKGNFGKKSGTKGKIASVYLDMANPVRIFKRLQAGGLCRWKAARKHALLRPFAWLYQIGSISRELLRKGVSPRDMSAQHRQGLRQRELIKSLGLNVDRYVSARD